MLAAAVLFPCYLRQSRTIAVGSDGASQALQAWDMLHGHPLLDGWWVTDVSFYTTELPQYALIEVARGLSADVIHVAGAMTYTLLVLAVAFLAKGTARGRAGAARALLAGGIMLAPQLGEGTATVLLSPDHTGTALPLLLIFLLIDRWWPAAGAAGAAGRAGRIVAVLAWLGLAGAVLADAMAVFVAVIPLVLVCAIRVLRGVALRREPLAAHRWDVALAAEAVLAVPTGLAAAALIRAVGGWQVNGLSTGLATPARLAGNVRLAGEGLLELFGADVFGAAGTGSPLAVAFAAAHLAGFALAVAGVAAAARRLTGDAGLVDSVLLAGLVIDLAAYLAGVQAVDIRSTREIAPVLPFAAVLAGRLLGARLLAAAPGRPRPAVTVGALAAVLACYAAMLGYAAAQPPAAPQNADLARWLAAHQLTAGLSGYHQANIVTLQTAGTVTLRPVTSARTGRIAAYAWNASSDWFDPARNRADFMVLAADAGRGAGVVTAAAAEATFGPPARRYSYRQYTILVWPPGRNLLAMLG